MPTQEQYNIVTQFYRDISIKLEVLDFDYYVIDEISGLAENASFNIDADSDIRRTCNISMILKDDYADNTLYLSEYWKSGNPFWFDKYLRISIGIVDVITGEVVWNNQGIYLIDEPSIQYSATDNTLSFKAVDLMAQLTGLRDGNLEGLTYVIPIGTSITSAMKSVIQEQGFNEYIILEPPQATTPYEIKVDAGGTSYDILSELRDINPDWEMFFNTDGIFIFQQIASSQTSDDIISPYITMEMFEDLYSEAELTTSFTDVKNYIEVYGKTIETNHSATTTVSSGSATIKLDMAQADIGDSVYDFLFIIGDLSNAIAVLSTPITTLHIYDTNDVLLEDLSVTNTPLRYNNYGYIIRISGSATNVQYLGYSQPFGLAWEDNEESPFYVGEQTSGDTTASSPTDILYNKPIFERQVRIVLSGGEFDNIYSNDLAMQRAKYELYLRARLHDSIDITIVPIYWLDVNQIIEYQMPNETEPSYWLIKNVSTDFSVDGSQKISAIRYYIV